MAADRELASAVPTTIWPQPATAWTAVALLTLANVVSLIDRQILTLMVAPIRSDLGLSDTGISLLHGFAFALFYSLLALPIARLADRGSRRTIIAIGIATWSVMTAACGLAKSFGQLFLARIGVGAGEATLAPAGNALIADLFPPERRTLPLGVFAAGISAGMGLSLLVGAAVVAGAERLGDVSLPLLGTVRPWQLVFLVLGVGGLPLALAITAIAEPQRQGAVEPIPLTETLAFLRQRWRTFGAIIAAYTLLVASANGIAAWTPAHYMRNLGLGPAEVGTAMGLVILAGGPLGGWLGGAVTDRLRARGDAHAPLRVLAGCAVLMLIPAAAGSLMPTPALALFFLFWTFLLGSATVGPTIAALHGLTPNALRAQIVAVLYFFVNLIGLGTGPVAVALVTDQGFASDGAVGWSIAIVATLYTAAGAACATLAIRASKK